jgi:hypothetical protein
MTDPPRKRRSGLGDQLTCRDSAPKTRHQFQQPNG